MPNGLVGVTSSLKKIVGSQLFGPSKELCMSALGDIEYHREIHTSEIYCGGY